MPCNSDYMDASNKEVELSRVACLLDELKGKPINENHWDGYHPRVYNNSVDGDALVAELCGKLQQTDVTKYSLEMQIWWRDHQQADEERLKKESEDQHTEQDHKEIRALQQRWKHEFASWSERDDVYAHARADQLHVCISELEMILMDI